jgi:hypothetical protein
MNARDLFDGLVGAGIKMALGACLGSLFFNNT